MLKLENIVKKYRTSAVETLAVNGLSITINQGEFVAIMGASGCGKSTLLNIIGMLDNADSGSYFLDGKDVSSLKANERTDVRKNTIGFVFQNFNLIDELTVGENVELPLQYLNIPKSERKQKVDRVLEKMGIAHRKNHYPSQLSGGQQQRVAVARAVVTEPKLVLADEPTGNLDSHFGNEVLDILKGLNAAGTTIVMVTHSSNDAKVAQRIIELRDGKLLTERVEAVNQL
ncbi:putative ABC transport system ATP-binding protein [Lishizhenia tianjinensis]|uniref:Putative ABC transport system ATP-binding protein n=1 Tax=Lishizhenia tianjinensis TaxID=477690 RepID=A0A1I6YLP4_9FLAO|nr:ABC transporter ATP-binding protein [Lishizhenia tianjinensis]SFT51171.1 putative ABC transport system ATP-binding protein [Lishizhenia tianjinensis]